MKQSLSVKSLVIIFILVSISAITFILWNQPYVDSLKVNDLKTNYLSSNQVKAPVTAIWVNNSNKVALGQYSDGYLRRWDLETGNLIIEIDIGVNSLKHVRFSENGEFLFAPLESRVVEDYSGVDIEYIGGIWQWDTNTGKRVQCFASPCENIFLEEDLGFDLGYIIDNSENRIIVYDEYGYRTTNIENKSSGKIVNLKDSLGEKINGLEIGNAQEIYAYALVNGRINIIHEKVPWPFYFLTNRSLQVGDIQKDGFFTEKLLFSPNEKFLAIIYDSQLFVWKLGFWRVNQIINKNLSGETHILYDTDSKILFVAEGNFLELWDLKMHRVEQEIEMENNITCIEMSSDQSMIILGDDKGIIHIFELDRDK